MKKIFITTLLALFATIVQAQEDYDQEAIAKLSDDTCACITKIGEIESEAQAEIELGKCIITAYGKDAKYYKSKGLNFTAGGDAEKIGEAIGMNLAMNCGSFLDIFMEFELGKAEEEAEAATEFETLTGRLLAVDTDTFNVLTVEDSNGRKHKVLWLTYVDNGVLLDQALRDKNTYTFVVRELDIYDPRIEDYRNRYVLQSIEE